MVFNSLASALICFLWIEAQVGQGEGALSLFKRTDDLIADEGYMPETHEATTVDGYVITIFRIPYGLDGPSTEPRPVILLTAGVGQNSDEWVVVGNNSLPYLLVNEGYDVWIGNYRGGQYGKENLYYPTTSKKFWDYSFHENGVYDLPAIIDYVLKKTGQSDLIYIGHSQGTTAFFVLLSLLPQYNKKISLGVLYAPVMDARGIKTPFYYMARDLYEMGKTEKITNALGFHSAFSSGDLSKMVRFFICNKYSLLKQLCWDVLFLLSGFDYSNQRNLTYSGQLFSHILDTVSTKDLFHFLQTGQTGRFAQYDYRSKNLEIYGRLTPPRYHVENIKVPLFLAWGENDFLSTKKVFTRVTRRLKTPYKKYHVPYKAFNHGDFLLATAPELLSIPTINYIKEFTSTV